MSYILDALRKSENERRQGDNPGITAARYRVDKRRRSIWLPLIGAILLVNAALLAFLLLRPSGDGDSTTPVALPEPLSPPPMAGAARPAPRVRPLSREVSPPSEAPAATPATPVVQDSPSMSAAAATGTDASNGPRVVSPDNSPVDTAVDSMAGAESIALPTLQQLVLNGEMEMPPLRIDMHVYSPEASQRFVFINMSKYREGERIKEGPQIETIDSAGVILSHQGRRFTLARE